MSKPSADGVVIKAASATAAPLMADLMYQTDPHIFGAMHGHDRALADRHLAAQWLAETGLFSHRYAEVAVFDGEPVGMCLGFDHAEQQAALAAMSELAAACLSASELMAMLDFFEYGAFLLPPVPDDAWYLQNLAVIDAARSRGIGERLLHHCFDKARDAGYARLQLDVFDGNPAQRLYERCGMRIVVHTRVEPLAQEGMPDHLRMELKF
jgi:ribosomal protein S18 acetylase RimI-like enzyme